MSVAYFEGWNPSRPCLQMDVGQIDDTKYTHVHFGFGALTANNYQVNISSDTQSQFARFTSFKTPMKKILSIGGWTFSTAPFDYDIFRTGMTAGNRDTMSTNIANFIIKNNLDGVDIDWEYPGAPDIPNIPPGNPSDGPNYLAFLKLLKGKLPGKTVSIAAPASYWYLKGFPIADMAKVVDYVVYMTYDLHGQWDYGNQWADPGCPSGSCLRSHINLTETLNALSMITKAGVPSNMILVGVSSYGRSFGMTTPGCTGPMCKFTGPNSGATPGPCTQTGGYISNAEINMIIGVNNSGLNQFSDAESDSDILVFNANQWVAYMTDQRKASRVARYKSLNFGGTSDWAVDLQQVYPPSEAIPDTETFSAIDPTIEGCSTGDAAHVLQAWREAGELVKIHGEWSPKGKWQNAMDLYMGTGTQKDWDFWGDPGPVGRKTI
jgi:GH18 family chitinase